MKRLEFTPDPTMGDAPLFLQTNEVFVFGANELGSHRAGSAKAAVDFYGAVMGEIHRTGRSYGIVTLDKTFKKISIESLRYEFRSFIKQTELEPEKTFYLTKVGLGIAGWKLEEVVFCFTRFYFPSKHTNIILPKEFSKPPLFDYNTQTYISS